MRLDKLPFLACPDLECRGVLKLDGEEDSEEIMEGWVVCGSCGETYPVLKGVLILVPNVWNYLARNFFFLKGICTKYGGLSSGMLKTIMTRLPFPLPKQVNYDESRQRAFEKESAFYLLSHYGGLNEAASPDEPLFRFLAEHQTKSPHDVLEGFLQKAPCSGIALEVGCNVGGFLKRLSSHYETVFGVDLNLEILILARKMLKPGNVEVLLALGESLPFADGSLGLTASVNVLDVVEKPERFLQEQIRVLNPNGQLLLTHSNYPSQEINNVLRDSLAMAKEQDPVCWIYRKGPRNYEIFYTHCLSAVKKRN